jgi:hypothetical protein
VLQAHLDALQKKMKPVGRGGMRAKGAPNGSRPRRQPAATAPTTPTT